MSHEISVIDSDSDASKLCNSMEKGDTSLAASKALVVQRAREKFQQIALGSNNLIFVTGGVNREKANYYRVHGKPYDPERCPQDKTKTSRLVACTSKVSRSRPKQ